jgi:hypothetical protein
LYRAKERVTQSGLYRCTTCGVMIPLNAGEELPECPSHCADVIWTYFNEKWSAPPVEVREATESFEALDINGEHALIPAGAQLSDVGLGPSHAGSLNDTPSLAAFHFDGQVYFGSAAEFFKKTKVRT